MALPKLVLTDIDGVWTDGGMYYSSNGEELKKFNTSDSAGILFCKLLNIPTGIITGEDTPMVKRRAKKLKVDYLFMGAKNKVGIIKKLIEDLGITFSEVAYIGDDINDIALLQKVGISASPANAPDYVKKHSQFHTVKSGGEGAFREFVEQLLKRENKLELVLEKYLETNKFEQ